MCVESRAESKNPVQECVAKALDVKHQEIAIKGFNMYCTDRTATRGGGMILYIRETFRSCFDSKLICWEIWGQCLA